MKTSKCKSDVSSPDTDVISAKCKFTALIMTQQLSLLYFEFCPAIYYDSKESSFLFHLVPASARQAQSEKGVNFVKVNNESQPYQP